MQNSYDFVGGPLHGQRKALDPADLPMAVDGGTYRPTGGGHSVGDSPTVYTALFWPHRESAAGGPPARIKVGDPFPLDVGDVGDCSAVRFDATGILAAMCVLDEGHSPAPHVATDGRVVVEVWD